MKLIEQRAHGCVPAAIFMLNDNKDMKKIKNLCKKRFGYSHSRGSGCQFGKSERVLKMMCDVGLDATHTVEEGTQFRSVGMLSSHGRGLLLIIASTGVGHAIAWDGYRGFDPNQDKLISEYDIDDIYGKEVAYDFILYAHHGI